MDTQDFIKTVNSLRLENKGKWYTFVGVVNDKSVVIKAYGTWLQVFKVDGLIVPTVSDISIKDFKEILGNSVN